MKRITSLLVAALFAVCAWAAADPNSGTCGESVAWSFNSETGVLTISGTGAMTNYDNSSYYSRTPWRQNYLDVKEVIVGEGVTSIGDDAFSECNTVASVTLPSTLTSIGKKAFNRTALTSVQLPSSLSTIGNDAFYYTKMQEVTIPESVTSIGSYAFYMTSTLSKVTFEGTTAPTCGTNAFGGSFVTKCYVSCMQIKHRL